VTYTLAADGPSDRVLLPVITWSLKRWGTQAVVAQWADFGRIPRRRDLAERLTTALELYPCDVLFVHRDAEGQPSELRREEIANALARSATPHIPVVPVRMTEAWLLADEMAIRSAAGNPRGVDDLNLPDLRTLEALADPKRVLQEALYRASGLNVRRRSRLPVWQRIHQIPNYIDDYSILDALPAFSRFQEEVRVLPRNG
jgi:hypothetical protein